MSPIIQIFTIILSLMIGTSYSAIITILMKRGDKVILHSILYSVGVHTLFIIFLISLLLWGITLFGS